MIRVQTLSPALQSLYSELVEQAVYEKAMGAGEVSVSPVLKSVKGNRYWYLQETQRDQATGRQKQTYFGPDNEETRKRLEGITQIKDAIRDRKQLVASLRGVQLATPHPVMGEVLKRLSRDGFFDSGGCLVGTVAYQTYEGVLGVKFSGSAAMTMDVDVAKEKGKGLELVPPSSNELLIEKLKGIDPTFIEVPGLRNEGTGAYLNKDRIRVDVLTPADGSARCGSQYMADIQSFAQRMEHLKFLLKEPIKAVVLHDTGVLVNVPSPDRYAVHKLLVAQSRGSMDSHKIVKDLAQAETLCAALLQKDRGRLAGTLEEACGQGKSWEKKIRKSLESLDRDVRDELKAFLPEKDVTKAKETVKERVRERTR